MGQAPLVQHPFPPADPGHELPSWVRTCAGQDQVGPRHRRLHPAGQALEPGRVLAPDAGQEVVLGDGPAVGPGPDGGRPGGAVEVLGRQPELRRPLDLPLVVLLPPPSLERPGQDEPALDRGRHRGVHDEGHGAAPRRVPRAAAHQDERPHGGLGEGPDRRRAPVGQRLDRAGHDDAPPQACLPGQPPGEAGFAVAAVEPGQVGQEDPESRPAGGGRGQAEPGAPVGLADVDEGLARRQRPLEGRRVADGGVDVGHGHGQDQRIRLVVAQQVGGHPVGHPQGPGEERAVGLLHDDEPAVDQRPGGAKPGTAAAGRVEGAAQLEGEPDAGPAAGDVVVQVAVQALELRVEVGGQGDEQDLGVEGGEVEGPGEAAEAQVGTAGFGGVGAGLDGGEQLDGGQQLVVGPPAGPWSGRSGSRVPASSLSTSESGAYRPRKRSPGSGSSLRRRPTATRTRSSTTARRPSRWPIEAASDSGVGRRVRRTFHERQPTERSVPRQGPSGCTSGQTA